jgi:hypothetical protein
MATPCRSTCIDSTWSDASLRRDTTAPRLARGTANAPLALPLTWRALALTALAGILAGLLWVVLVGR